MIKGKIINLQTDFLATVFETISFTEAKNPKTDKVTLLCRTVQRENSL